MYKINTIFLLSILFVMLFSVSFAQQSDGSVTGTPWRGEDGITVSVSKLIELDLATPKKPFAPKIREEYETEREPKANPNAPAVSSWPPISEQNQEQSSGIFSPQTVGTNWLGIKLSESGGYYPPDIMGDVGPTQVLVHVNGYIKVFNKTGTTGGLSVTDNTFWTSVRNGQDVSDPHVRYDPVSKRWFLAIINLAASSNRILIAVSSGSTITNTSSFTFYQFQYDAVGTPGSQASGFADYPTLGVDANALYIGANIFNAAGTSFLGSCAYVVRKSTLLTGSLVVTGFYSLNNGSGAGPYTPQGVQNDDSTATEGYVIGVDNASYSQLDIRRITNPGGTPTISGNLFVTVPTTVGPITQTVKGSTASRKLDALEDRLYAAMIKKNKLTGVTSLWTSHNIEVNSSGVGTTGGGRNGSRWYEITNLTTTPTLRQSGTVFSSAATPIGYWIPSVAMSGQGHMALGCSYAGANDYASIAVAGRLSTDVLGTTQSPTNAVVSNSAYNDPFTGTQRWGDYTQTVVDPTDDMTMWSFQEYVDTTNSWALRVIKLIAPAPATPSSVSPSTLSTGVSNVNLTLTGTSTSGTGFFDPGTGFTNRLAASVSGTGVTVNSVTFTNATSMTLNVTVAANATAGARTITVTNPDGQTATSATAILTISNVSCPTITLSPTTLPNGDKGGAYNQTITASGGVAPYTYTVTGGALPTGISLSTGGVVSGTPSVSGTFLFTVTASDSNSCTGSKQDTLTINACPTITLSPASLPDGSAGSVYNQTVTSSGGVSTYSYAVTSGSLPAGMTFSTGGALSGTPTYGGTYNFTVTSTDSHGCPGTKAYTLVVTGCPLITLSPLTLPGAITGASYNQTLTANGGKTPYTYNVTSGALPLGLTLSGAGGITGSSSELGTANFTVTATDSNECSVSLAYSITISNCPAITLSPSTLSSGTIGVAYSQTITSSGGTSAYTYAVTSGSLPAGLSLSSGGSLTGSPAGVGSSSFTVTSTDANNCTGTQAYTLQVNAVSGNFIALATSGGAYTQDFNTLPATGTTDSTLPAGWSLKETGSGSPNNTYAIGTGSSNSGNTYDFGSSSSTDRAFGGIQSNSVNPTIGAGFINNTGATITSLQVAYTCEQWRMGVTSRTVPDTLVFQFSQSATSLSTGTWTEYDSLNGYTTLMSGTIGGLDGNASANRKAVAYTISGLSIGNGTSFFIRWIDGNISNADDGLAVDDFSITPYTTAPTTNPSIAVSATPDTLDAGSATLLKATVTPGTTPTSTGLTVTADLSAIGGSASQSLFDDGTNGDVTGNDNIFSYSATVTGGTTAGVKSVSFAVADSQARSNNTTLAMYITTPGCSFITVSPTTLPDGTVGSAYTQTVTASGGTTPYTFTVSSGTLPAGVSLATNGALTGTVTSSATSTFTVTATDSNGCTGSRDYTVHATCPTITVAPASLAAGTTGSSYSQTITASGGTTPYSFLVTTGTLPTGLSLATTGELTGTPSVVGSSSFTVTATDSNGCTGSKAYTVQVNAPVVTISLTTPGTAYSQDFNTLAMTGTSSTLPAGWLFYETGASQNTLYSAGNGTLTAGDTYSFGIDTTATDRALGGLQSGNLVPSWGAGFTNNTGAAITSLIVSYTGEQWRTGATSRTIADTIAFQLSTDASAITGGTWTPYSSLNFASPFVSTTVGALDGNATANRASVGAILSGLNIANGANFFIRWTDANVTGADDGLSVDDFSITPNTGATPTNPTVAGNATPDTVLTGSTTLLTATVTPGANPTSTGLAVKGNLTSIGGSSTQPFYDDGTHGDVTQADNDFSFSATIPGNTTAGTKNISLNVTDAQFRSGSITLSVVVTRPPCPTITISPSTLPDGVKGTAYNQTITASGGASPYTYSVTNGSLPAGLTLTSGGVLSGTPTSTATATFTITATDTNLCTGSQAYTVQVTCPAITVSPATLPNDTTGNSYPQTITASGGHTPYTFAVTTGSLPAGLSLSSAGAITGTLSTAGTFSFTITATDSFACTGNQAYSVTVVDAQASVTVSVQSRWNIVSNPLIVTNDSVHALFPTATGSAFAFTAIGYQAKTQLTNGLGYWLNFASGSNVTLIGKPMLSDTVDVLTGWNIIGSVTHAVSASSITSIPSGIQTGSFFKYNNGYVSADSILPGQGYWVKTTQAGKLILSSSSILAANRIQITPNGEMPPAPPQGLSNNNPIIPTEFALEQNYPNPFNPTTNFNFQIPDVGTRLAVSVQLKIYNTLGKEVATIINQEMNPGSYTIQWDASNIPSGVYYYRMTSGQFSAMKKLLLMK